MEDQPITWKRDLSSTDLMMYRGDSTARSRSSMMYIETLDRVPDWQRLRTETDRVSRVAIRLRQHVVAPLLPLAPARWVVDPDFDLDYHLRRITLPEPRTFEHLLEVAAKMYASPLDLSRPLWEVTLVDGLEGGEERAALVWKMSHAITDGVGGVILDRMLRTTEREPPPRPMPTLPSPEDVTPMELTRAAARRLPLKLVTGSVRRLSDAAGTARRAARDPQGAVRDTVRVVGTVRKLVSAAVEPSPLLAGRSVNRRFAAHDVALADLRAAAKAQGCSVNDAYLSAVTGALRRYHEELGMPIAAITMALPINLRTSTEAGAIENKWAAATVAAPVAERDPVRRMRALRELVLTARTDANVDVLGLIAPVLAWFPEQLLAGVGAGTLGIDVQVSNVPGNAAPRYVAGAKVLRAVPRGPVPGGAMMGTMRSASGRCFVGVNYDPAAVTDHDRFVRCLREGFDEVLATTGGSTRRSSAKKAPTSPARKPAPAPKPAKRAARSKP